MPKAIIFGAGNIGRGFIGKTLADSGYEVCFIDIVTEVVNKLNEDKTYPVRIVSNNSQKEETVKNVRAILATEIKKIQEEIASADLMATAVGVNVLPKIVRPICEGLKVRFQVSNKPLNIIICENMIHANQYLRGFIEQEMGGEYKQLLDQRLGLVEASIGRMVPVMTDEMREGNLLRVWVEPYNKLPVDKEGFVGEIPSIKNLIPYTPFSYYIKSKLFVHNMGHAICAYLGWIKGYEFIYQCIEDNNMRNITHAAMCETGSALCKEYEIEKQQLKTYIDDLLDRFGNRALGDTVERVAKDPIRKLSSQDRLVGAALYCNSMGVESNNIYKGIYAALNYNNPKDPIAMKMQQLIKEIGIRDFLMLHCGLNDTKVDEILSQRVQP